MSNILMIIILLKHWNIISLLSALRIFPVLIPL